jgi:hypothetical protein
MAVATARREAPAYVRRATLGADEYHTNFRKMDCETISRLTSDEAGRVTSQMCKVYLSLLNAPAACWEREGVLRFAGEERGDRWTTAWEQLVALAGVASATARKALKWMHEEGIVGYFAGKNGVGIRIFMNRAASSIGRRPAHGQKNLRLVPASTEAPRASADDTPFKDSFADLEVLETDLNPRAPKNGADETKVLKSSVSPQRPSSDSLQRGETETETARSVVDLSAADELTGMLLVRLEPALRAAASQAAAREHERTREWLENRGLPKAARVAQREAFNVLRQQGLIGADAQTRARGEVGRRQCESTDARRRAPEEIRELAEACVAMLEVHGQAVGMTLAELSAEGGGHLSAEDTDRVRALAEEMLGRQPATSANGKGTSTDVPARAAREIQ